jgi:hypothetical protein
MMARSSNAPSMGRIQKRKTNLSKSSLSACNARPVHTDGPMSAFCTAENPPRSTVAFLSFPTSGMISLEGAHAITSTQRYTDE